MWAHLVKIRQLQSEIAKMHLSLDQHGVTEGIGVGRRASALNMGDDDLGLDGRLGSGGEDKDGSEGVAELNRRKESIANIVGKVRDR
jgi:hypothetical protein